MMRFFNFLLSYFFLLNFFYFGGWGLQGQREDAKEREMNGIKMHNEKGTLNK